MHRPISPYQAACTHTHHCVSCCVNGMQFQLKWEQQIRHYHITPCQSLDLHRQHLERCSSSLSSGSDGQSSPSFSSRGEEDRQAILHKLSSLSWHESGDACLVHRSPQHFQSKPSLMPTTTSRCKNSNRQPAQSSPAAAAANVTHTAGCSAPQSPLLPSQSSLVKVYTTAPASQVGLQAWM